MLPLAWISVALPLGMISGVVVTVIKGIGRADVSLKNMAAACIIMPVAFGIGCKWGIVGVSLAWAIGYPTYFLIAMVHALPYMNLRLRDMFREIVNPGGSSIIMYLTVAATRFLLKGDCPPVVALAILVTIGTIVYGGLQIGLNRKTIQEIIGLVKK